MAIHCGYVVASDGGVYLQLPADNRYGFVIADDDQTWDSPPFGGWEAVADDDPRVGDDDRGRLGWILDDARTGV